MKGKKLLSALFLSALTFMSFGAINTFALYDSYYVSNFRDFKVVLSGANHTDYIIFENDINLESSIRINKSITLDLNGHTLYLPNNDAVLYIGDKIFDHTERYTETKFSFFEPEGEIKTSYNTKTQAFETDFFTDVVWFSFKDVEKTKDAFRYFDEVDVIIKNGVIIRKDGADGEDGKSNTWFDYNGKNGETPKEAINMISGILRLENTTIYAGNGGNGGNGSYQSLIHIPFGGGNAGNGGNGGNGGGAIYKTREECKVYGDENSELVPGKPGKGGQSANVNEDYWVYSGWNGFNGKVGKDGAPIWVRINKK